MQRAFIILAIVTLLSISIWYFFFSTQAAPQSSAPEVRTGSFFPKPEQISPQDDTNTNESNSAQQMAGNSTTSTQDTGTKSPFSKMTDGPVAGFISYERQADIPPSVPGEMPKKNTEHVIRYASRTNGYVFEVTNTTAPLRISNILIPNIYEALFTSDGKSVVERFLQDDQKTISSYIIPIPDQNPDGSRTQKEGTYLANNISSLALSPDGKKSVGVITSAGNTSITTFTIPSNTADKPTVTAKEIYKSPFSEWLVSWPVQKAIFMQSKASNSSEGFLYNLDNITTKLRRILGNIYGMTTSVSPSGNYAVYSQNSDNSSIATYLYNIKSGSSLPIGRNILPEKCAWLSSDDLLCAGNDAIPDGSYPDSWYAGVSHFNDNVYRISARTGDSLVIGDGTEKNLDMINLQVDESQQLLYFMDKKTGILWRLSYQ